MKNNKALALIIFVSSILLSFLFFFYQDFFKTSIHLGLLGIFVINAISSASFFVSGPAFLTVISGGSIYPPIIVALVAAFGSSAGDMLSYLVGYSGRSLAYKKLEKKFWFRVFEKYFQTYGTVILFIMAFVPNFLFDSIGLFAGVFGYSPKKFFLIVFIGRFLRFVALAYIGRGFFS